MKVTVDAVVFAYIEKELNVLLIKRAFEPYLDQWALPGGFMNEDESADDSVIRKLKEETNVNLNYLEQLYTFANLDRDPRGRIVSLSYYALINPSNHELTTNIHAKNVEWVPYDKLDERKMAFDHREIIDYAWVRLKNKVRYEPIGFELLPKEFTMSDLYDLYYAIFRNQTPDRRNFIKKIHSFDLLKALPKKTEGHVGRRAQLFEFNKEKYNKLKVKGFNFDI